MFRSRVGIPRYLAVGLFLAVLNLSGHPTYANSPNAAAPPGPMARAAFADLLLQLQRKSFGDEKLKLVRDAAAAGHHFTCEQVGQLMRTSAFADEEIQIAATLYARLVDPEHLGLLLKTLPLPADREKLRHLLRF